MIAQLDKEYIKSSLKKTITRLVSYTFFEGRPITAPGQWINPLVFKNLNYGAKRYPKTKLVKPTFILGTGRSGTTILGKLLSMHHDIGYLNEPKAIWNILYPFEDITANFTTEPANYVLTADIVTKEMQRRAHSIYQYYLEVVKAKRVVDKYPELIFRKSFVEGIFPDAKFVLITRNGWDTCSSIEMWSKRKGGVVNGEVHDWWGRDNRKWKMILVDLVPRSELLSPFKDELNKIEDHQSMAAVEWILTMEEALKVLDRDKNMVMIKYEDLLADSNKILTDLTDFMEINQDAKMLNYAMRVLTPSIPAKRFELNESIIPAFNQVMSTLGYS